MPRQKILIVEDEPIISMELSHRLKRSGYDVVGTSATGDDAIKKSAELFPDLILMDIQIHGQMDGIETARTIRSKQDIPVVYLTAFSDEKTLERAKLTQPYGFLIKPFEQRELESTIEVALHNREKELKQKEYEQWLDATLKNISDGIITTDNTGIINFVNHAAEEILLVNKLSILGKSIKELFRVQDYHTNADLENPALAILNDSKKELRNCEMILKRSDSSSVTIETTTSLIKLEIGTVSGTVVVFRDITEKKIIDTYIKESEQKYRTLFESMAQGVVYHNEDGLIISANSSALDILGLTMDQLSGRSSIDPRWKSIHEDGSEFSDYEHPSMVSLRTGKRIKNVLMGIYHWEEQKYRWIEIDAIPEFREGSTKPFRIFTTFTDITERKNILDELKTSQMELKELNATKDKFFSIVAHDLKSPFQGLLGFSNLLAENYEELNDEEIQKVSTNIHKATKNLYTLIDHLLNWSRLQSNRMECNLERLELHDSILYVFNLVTPNAMRKMISLEENVIENTMVLADERMLSSILENLISNAIKFTERGGIITVSYKTINNFVEVCVNDTGVGIEEEDKNNLFRIDKNHSHKGTEGEVGTGLGLILCHEMILKLGGEIRVVSELGKGSSFYITLPKAE